MHFIFFQEFVSKDNFYYLVSVDFFQWIVIENYLLNVFYSGWLKRPLRQEKKWGILSEPSQYPSLVKPTKLQR